MSKVLAIADAKARLDPASLGVPIKWPNEPFSKPEPPAPFLVVEIEGGLSHPIELGGSVWEGDGRTWVHVLVPVNTGSGAAFALVDDVAGCFRGPPLAPIVHESIQDDPGAAAEDDGNYWRISLVSDWRLQTYVPRS